MVHVFDLEGRPDATRAYAWSNPIDGSEWRRFFAVLQPGAIGSPLDAMRTAISLPKIWPSHRYRPNMASLPTALGAIIPGAIPALCRRFHVRQLDPFGSAVTGRFDPLHSDLDFLVAFEELSGSAYADAYFGLRDALAELFGREVDLLTDAALENAYLRRRVEAERERWFPPE
ncbi:MAG: nucleotidyltransferase family protein [Acetobacteraceae bacterium]